MTTTINFVPASNSNFQFSATLDGQIYNVLVNWSLFGCRYYVNIYSQSGQLIVCRAMTGSPLGYDLAQITCSNNIAVATVATTHTYTVGSVVPLVIAGANPADYNGTFNCTILNDMQFSFPLPLTTDAMSEVGTVNYLLSLTAGYFDSTLTYFPDNQQFVISP